MSQHVKSETKVREKPRADPREQNEVEANAAVSTLVKTNAFACTQYFCPPAEEAKVVQRCASPRIDSKELVSVMTIIDFNEHRTPIIRICSQGDFVTHTAWLNRSSILYAGEDKWSVDPRVNLVTLNQDEFTIKIEDVDLTDEGQYICAVQTSSRPRTTSVHIIVQGCESPNNGVRVMSLCCLSLNVASRQVKKTQRFKLLLFINELEVPEAKISL
ncbi:Neuronal growth regulator 1 [Labeo rohita]|uniref:Neuronal growth regulator 1 n=1 Tax=Labeo rohita TaxID=84645 RepID=A0ABQ8MA43_LABRO|nr:Neuronal growth regulator 1 [Labeo rohita]